jgi:hypothetical protein
VKKLFLAFMMFFLSFGIGTGALAAMLGLSGDARLDSLSADVREVEDPDLIWLYPNKVLEYKNSIDFRLGNLSGGGTHEWAGFLMDTGDGFGVLGAYVNRPNFEYKPASNITYGNIASGYYWFPVGAQGYFGSDYDNNYSNNMLDLFWAKPIGGADLGLHFNYGETFSAVQSENFGLSAGLGFANAGIFSEGNIHADLLVNKVTDGVIKDNGVYTILFGTLWQAGLDADNNVRLFGDMSQNQCKLNPADTSITLVNLGGSLNHKIGGGKSLISTGLILDYAGGSDNVSGEKLDSWIAVWNGAVEVQTVSWLTLRAGIEKAVVARSYDTAFTPTYQDNASAGTQFSAGFGINWQNWILDVNTIVGNLESSIQNVHPGNGLFVSGNILTSSEANLRYKF